ncbi:hypothetical protein D9619_005211 [Psilocybe cf. subviscida]|uniref:Uncharacterized protein n=1 Tax=Psilocybe cf. subviscida TaxID=2480587 RepID=A0A8H5BWB6_9AGAR|nr:hypothetical protein D9619_005211 [Psilocybe cf. subviscida]
MESKAATDSDNLLLHCDNLNSATGIALQLSQEMKTASCLGASIILGTASSSQDIDQIVSTIAYQLVQHLGQSMDNAVEDAISADPMIFKKAPYDQIDQLLVNPLVHVLRNSVPGNRARVAFVVFSGPCDQIMDSDSTPALIYQALHSVSQLPNSGIKFHFLFSMSDSLPSDTDFTVPTDIPPHFTATHMPSIPGLFLVFIAALLFPSASVNLKRDNVKPGTYSDGNALLLYRSSHRDNSSLTR